MPCDCPKATSAETPAETAASTPATPLAATPTGLPLETLRACYSAITRDVARAKQAAMDVLFFCDSDLANPAYARAVKSMRHLEDVRYQLIHAIEMHHRRSGDGEF